jgi:hypothetical protein
MAGTKAGGLKAAATNKAKHGADFYKRIGAEGGKNGHTGGFAANPTLAALAGAKGGRKSKRGPSTKPYKKRTPKKKVEEKTGFTGFIKKMLRG